MRKEKTVKHPWETCLREYLVNKLPSTCLRKVGESKTVQPLSSFSITMVYLSMWQRVKNSLLSFDLVSIHGLGFKPPSYNEIRVKYVKEEVANTSLALQTHRDEWKKHNVQ